MRNELNLLKKYVGAKFGYGEPIPDGTYAVPAQESAFLKVQIQDQKPVGNDNFTLYWDENLTIKQEGSIKPNNLTESKFSELFREITNL
jgi:hypothetical protein